MGALDLLSGYRFQALPNLSGVRDPTHSPLHAVRCLDFGSNEQEKARHLGTDLSALIRVAFVRVLLGYIDSPEFLFAEAPSTSRPAEGPFSLVRCNTAECKNWIDFAEQLARQAQGDINSTPEAVRIALDLPKNTNSLPARFVRGSFRDVHPTSSEDMLLLGLPTSNLRMDGDTLDLWAICDSTIMSQSALEIYLEQVCVVVTHILDNSTTPLSSIIPLTQKLKSAYEESYDSSRACVAVEWLIRNASERPDGIAHEIYHTLEEPPTILTFSELNSQSNRLANWFIQQGVKLEDKVAVCRARDEHFYIANAALFKSGACYISIDPELPLERRQFIVRDSGAKYVVTTAQLAPDFGEAALVLEEDDMQQDLSIQLGENVCLAQLDSLAYLLYTSGTTGTPKGCLLNHRGLYWAIDAMCTYPKRVTNPDTDKRLALASIAFDVHISEICQAWCLGICLVSAPRYEILADLQKNLINLGITHAGMVPSMIEATLTGPDDLPLKYLVSGGEKISDSLLRKWANHPSLILANFYGPTEATIGCTSRLIKQTDRKENIGHPFPSCRAYVVDASMNIVPRGNPGELVVEGPLVGQGYHNLPDATAKAFKKWPHEDCNAYRTGDLVRMMPDDTIEIMGRIDTQIKLRGVRIESEGISNVLRKASEKPLDVATLIAKHPDSGSELLVSFVAFGDRQVSVAERRSGSIELVQDFPPSLMQSLKAMATHELAVYMRPSHIVPLAFLPLSLNMKTDTKLLAEFFRSTPVSTLLAVQSERGGSSTSATKQHTLSSDQSSIAQIISRLSNDPLDNIQGDSNLFECGMDSIKLSAFARELRVLWPTSRITVTDVLANPVLDDIVQLCQSSGVRDPDPTVSACIEFNQKWRSTAENIFRPEDIEAVLPTFPIQDGVLFQALIFPSRYVQHFLYHVSKHVTDEDLHQGWSEVTSRHPILRTGFVVEDTPLQVVLKPESIYVPFSAHRNSVEENQGTFPSWFKSHEASRIAVEINEDLTTPAFRVNIYGVTDRFMAISLSHAIYDGVAIPNLMKDVDAAARGEKIRDGSRLQPILDTIDGSQKSAREFWVQKLDDINLSSIVARQLIGTKLQHTRRVLPNISYSSLQSICRSQRVTLQALGCASFALAGRDHFEWHENALFGIIRSGRSLPIEGIETAVLPLVSVVPFVLGTSSRSVSELLQDSQKELTSTSAYEHTPLGHIQRWIGAQPLLNTLFSCRVEEPKEPYKSFDYLQTDSPPPEFALAVEMFVDSATNTVELKAAYLDDISASDVDACMARMESYLELFNRPETVVHSVTPLDLCGSDARVVDGSYSGRAHDVDPKIEETLCATVASFLNVEESLVKPTSSLVALGLTSLKSVALSRKIKESNIVVSAIDIIQADTVRGIASKRDNRSVESQSPDEGQQWLSSLDGELRQELAGEDIKISPEDDPQILGATALQSGMLSQTIGSSDRLYVHGFTFKLRTGCSIKRLKAAWRQVIQETSVLRTSFVFAADLGRWVQVVHSQFDLPWSSRAFGDPSRALAEFISTLPFCDVEDFSRPPIHLCHFARDGHDYLLVVLHHALYDGISLPLLFNRIGTVYHGTDTLASTSFHDLVPHILIQEHFGVPYWSKKLEDIKPFEFPRSSNPAEGAWRSSASCELKSTDIERTCRRYQINVQCLGQAAMAKILHQISDQRDVVFCQVVSGRVLPGAENVIGPVFNTIPCRIDMSTSRNYGELLRKIQRSNNENLSYQHASLRSIQRALGVKAVTDALFLFQPNAPSGNVKHPPIWESLDNSSKDETKAQYGLNIELHQVVSGFSIRASCRASIMNQAALSDLLARFGEELRDIVLRPTSSIFDTHIPVAANSASSRCQSTAKELVDREKPAQMGSPRFDGWSAAQLQFRDILAAFTKTPSSAIQPNSQLASLGLDSISAIQVAGLAKRGGIRLSATDVAGSTPLADVAAIIAKRASSESQTINNTTPVQPLLANDLIDQARLAVPASLQWAVEEFLPTTPGMDFMLSSWRRSSGRRFQHMFAFKVSKGADVSRLRSAWNKLVERHAILRSVFVNLGDRNVLCVLKPGSIQIPWISTITGDKRSDLDEVGLTVKHLIANPPQLRGGPAAGISYIHGKELDYMVLSMHHALYDAWSFNILLRDLEDIYLDKPAASRNDLRYLAQATASTKNREQQRIYWQNAFHGFRPSIVESCVTQPTTGTLVATGKDLQNGTRIPLVLLFGTLQVLSLAQHWFSRQTRDALISIVTAGLGILALAPGSRHLRLFSSARGRVADTPTSPLQRTHVISRDLVLGFSTLHIRATERSLPLHMVLLACWAKAQAECSSAVSRDVSFGLVHSGRGLDGVDDIGAPCINMLPVYVRDALGNSTFIVAERLQSDLRQRSPVVEQSRLQDVSSWVGAPGKPLFRYFINLLKVPTSTESGKPSTAVLERIKVPVDSSSVPGPTGAFQESSCPPFRVMEEVLDDCMVEIFFDSKKDSIGMEITCEGHVMSPEDARKLAEAWAQKVRDAFS